MTFGISWLPPLIDLNRIHTSDMEKYLHRIFINELFNIPVYYNDFIVRLSEPKDPNYSYKVFQHITTNESKKYKKRSFDIFRAIRMRWCPALISHSSDPNVLHFDYLEYSGKIRTYLYLKPNVIDYLVILEKIKSTQEVMIISSYYVNEENRRRSYLEKYDKRII